MGRFTLSALFGLCIWTHPARAADPLQGVAVSFRDCASEPVGTNSFLAALALELDLRALPRDGAVAAAPEIDVDWRCEEGARIRIRLQGRNLERVVGFADVPQRQRARALALVVAELFRADEVNGSGRESNAAPLSASSGAGRPGRTVLPLQYSAENAALDEGEAVSHDATRERANATLRFRLAALTRASSPLGAEHWGAAFGAERRGLRLQLEFLLARSNVARGSLSTGVSALRIAESTQLVQFGPLALRVGASVACGVTWAVGHSEVPGTIVRDVLQPYADAQLEFATRFPFVGRFEPELMFVGGPALGIRALADSRRAQATGGWGGGMAVGALF